MHGVQLCMHSCIAHRHIFSQNWIVDTITADSTKGGGGGREMSRVPTEHRSMLGKVSKLSLRHSTARLTQK